jgi:uncharacterized protein YuzE
MKSKLLRLEYDPEVNCFYLRLKKARVVRSVDVGGRTEVVVDLDKKGDVVGIELIQPTRATLRRVARDYHLPDFSLADLEIISPVAA